MASDATALSAIHDRGGAEALIGRVAILAEMNIDSARIFRLTDAHGTMLAGNLLAITPDAPQGFVHLADLTIASGPHDDEVSGYWISSDTIGPYTLLQGTDDHVVGEVLEALSAALVGGFVIVVGLGLLVGIRVGRITERRIAQISETLDRVSAGELTARIAHPERFGDDLARVSSRINATLRQLQALLESQQQISTDIAHDMRTPLQRLRQRLERMAAQEPPAPADTAAALSETEGIITTFNALLRIAQIEAGDRRERFAPVDLNLIAETVFDLFDPAAEDAGQSLHLTLAPGPAQVFGDRDLLMQLLANLVENALRHCPPGSSIGVGVDAAGGMPALSVSDNGPGIADADAEKVFRRFYRAEESRAGHGHGLGLAMVRAIADLHQASVTIAGNAPGLLVRVAFQAGRG
jgi:signal transduction histidine kinase